LRKIFLQIFFGQRENVGKFEAAGFAIRDTFADLYVNGLYHLNFISEVQKESRNNIKICLPGEIVAYYYQILFVEKSNFFPCRRKQNSSLSLSPPLCKQLRKQDCFEKAPLNNNWPLRN
jgi:hypothetical protein